MKKAALILVMVLFINILTGCGSNKPPANVRQEIYDIAIEVLSDCDLYLDGKISLSSSYERIGKTREQLKNIGGFSNEEDKIYSTILEISNIFFYGVHERNRKIDLDKINDDILKYRNRLAERSNQPLREK